jgi:hypothetical protein
MSRTGLLTALIFGIMVALSGAAFAQDAGGGGGAGGGAGGAGGGGRGGRGGGGGGGGNFDPAAMRERMMAQYKERLGANDEEWKVLQPRIEKVMTAQRDARAGGFGFAGAGAGGGRGGRGGGGGGGAGGGGGGGAAAADQSPVAKASADLRSALESNAAADEIKNRLAALREAKAKAREELTKSQKELQEVVTAKQEAQLVVSGLLE